MSDGKGAPRPPADSLEDVVRATARETLCPPTPPLAARVRARLEAERARPPRRGPLAVIPWRWAAPGLALVAATVAVVIVLRQPGALGPAPSTGAVGMTAPAAANAPVGGAGSAADGARQPAAPGAASPGAAPAARAPADAGTPAAADLDGAVANAVDRFGGLDAAVAAAGCIAGGPPAWEVDDDLWAAMVGVNLEGVWRLARAAVPALLARPAPRHGRFVAVSSSGGTDGLPFLAAYVAAKHGVNGLVRSLAAELGPHGVTANAVAPGSTRTAMLEASAGVYGLASVDAFTEHHLLGRLLDPDEVAALVAWVCGPTSGGVTGAVLPVDAGMTA
jgi:SDR family mycofactocin-dependent oxidoreductase